MVDWKAVGKKTQDIVVAQFIPISFFIAVLWAMLWPAPGKAVGSVVIGDGIHLIAAINTMIVFLISGLMLKTEDIKTALKHKMGCLYGLITILFVTPCLGFALEYIPLDPPEYATGLTIMAAVPTTLGVGVSLARACGGNEGLALLLTVVSNILGVVTVPLWLKAFFHDDPEMNSGFDMLELFLRLLIEVFVPSVIGKAMRELWPAAKRFATKYRTALSLFSTANLAFIVWQTLSGAQSIIVSTPFVNTLYVILLASAQHIIYVIINFAALLWVFKMPMPESVAAGIMGSQKSAPVAVTVISNLSVPLSTQGLLAVPCICGQIFQIFLGSMYTPYLKHKVNQYKAKLKEEEAAALGDVVEPNGTSGVDIEHAVASEQVQDGVDDDDKVSKSSTPPAEKV